MCGGGANLCRMSLQPMVLGVSNGFEVEVKELGPWQKRMFDTHTLRVHIQSPTAQNKESQNSEEGSKHSSSTLIWMFLKISQRAIRIYTPTTMATLSQPRGRTKSDGKSACAKVCVEGELKRIQVSNLQCFHIWADRRHLYLETCEQQDKQHQ